MRSTYLYIGYFFLLLLVFVLLGFYKTYIVLFPEFNGINLVKHFHGACLFCWFLLMIIQPFLMHYKRYRAHKAFAKVSYIIVPLVMISIFLVSRDKYHRMEPIIPHSENIGELALNIPSIFYFGLLYVLAMYYRKNNR